jgi:hypothetical protein
MRVGNLWMKSGAIYTHRSSTGDGLYDAGSVHSWMVYKLLIGKGF